MPLGPVVPGHRQTATWWTRRGVEGPGMPGGQGQRKKEELHKALREHREPTPEEVLGQATAQRVGHGGDAGQ